MSGRSACVTCDCQAAHERQLRQAIARCIPEGGDKTRQEKERQDKTIQKTRQGKTYTLVRTLTGLDWTGPDTDRSMADPAISFTRRMQPRASEPGLYMWPCVLLVLAHCLPHLSAHLFVDSSQSFHKIAQYNEQDVDGFKSEVR
eukprot:TRINITY_DN52813_c0_g1_i1.p2 TRINITY_DN52813_c0_g1~~TRINITY_DN52813_c0_g1_i1.p2  ORF type:complete len:144 (+),score=7.98 TRINITY_DN52813_c0_g1_i1:111-542(+)